MASKEITLLAKRICRANKIIAQACAEAENLTHDSLLKELSDEKNSPSWRELCEKVQKYDTIGSSADTRTYASELDDATDILSDLFLRP